MKKHDTALKHLQELASELENESRAWKGIVQRVAANDASMTAVELHYASLGAKGSRMLGKSLKKNTYVKELKLGGNDIGDEGAKRLAKAMASLKQLEEVDLSFNGITDEGAKHLIVMLKANASVKSLVLFGNALSESVEDEIVELLDSDRSALPGEEKNGKESKGEKEIARDDHEDDDEDDDDDDNEDMEEEEAPKKTASPLSDLSRPMKSFSTKPLKTSALTDAREAANDGERMSVTRTLSDTSTEKRNRRRTKDSTSSSSRRKSKRRTKRTSTSEPSSKEEVKIKLLENTVRKLQQSETEYIARIEELEQRLLLLSQPKGNKPRKLIRQMTHALVNKDKVKKITVSCDEPVVTQRLAATGGSNAGVYSCLVDGFACAMKELDLTYMDEYCIAAFLGEIRLLELMPRHDNIVRYLFHEETNDKIRLFMTQYSSVLGTEIQKRCKEGKVFPVQEVAKIALDIIKGLEFLHDQGIIHRDLKSDNVFVLFDERKSIKRCAIGDFDTAKRLTGKAEKAKTVLGTPAWMAPEVMKANTEGEYGFPCDVYSFGMVLYELLTLKMPYDDVNPMMISMHVMQGKKPTAPKLPEEYAGLVEVYDECTHLEPQDRLVPHQIKHRLSLFI